ncbi:ketosteroid isomerase-related protein [Pseudomarimonas arenosa]|uniref:Nuclear transport factor 2 family protein n=1 Tax=Pseudomarimonas arenosa TaxID=2774145 RepID=A0AAW3ZQH7_9GAMM|nr:ketosteroid isomerase-related protein [Pseudomarimonas arenosa]MBD8526852.1 nuclear transport factor 2 family protein [Pseudomarimonas arenosa]
MLIDGVRSADRATERVLAYYAAFNQRNHPALLSMLCEDVVHDVNQGRQEIGREAFATFLQRMDRCYREQIGDVVVMVTNNGRRAAAEYVVSGEYLHTDEGLPPASGQRYRLAGGAFFELREGQISRVTNYYNLGDWLAQIGGDRA